MRGLFALAVSTALAVWVMAAAHAAQPKEGAPGTNVDMPFLMAPMTGSDGNLSGYAYVTSRLTATSAAGALEVRDKIAFVQDAFVRDVNEKGVAPPSDTPQVDNGALFPPIPLPAWAGPLEARLLTDARKVMGVGTVASISVTMVRIAPLHPVPLSAAPPPQDMAATPPAKPTAKP